MPRFVPDPFDAALRFSSQPDAARTRFRHSDNPALLSATPIIHSSPGWTAFLSLTSIGSMPSLSAISSIWVSPAMATCGPPKPRNAPERSLLV